MFNEFVFPYAKRKNLTKPFSEITNVAILQIPILHHLQPTTSGHPLVVSINSNLSGLLPEDNFATGHTLVGQNNPLHN